MHRFKCHVPRLLAPKSRPCPSCTQVKSPPLESQAQHHESTYLVNHVLVLPSHCPSDSLALAQRHVPPPHLLQSNVLVLLTHRFQQLSSVWAFVGFSIFAAHLCVVCAHARHCVVRARGEGACISGNSTLRGRGHSDTKNAERCEREHVLHIQKNAQETSTLNHTHVQLPCRSSHPTLRLNATFLGAQKRRKRKNARHFTNLSTEPSPLLSRRLNT